MASFVLSFFPLDVLDEIWVLIESVSEGFFTYSSILPEQVSPNSLPTFNLITKRSTKPAGNPLNLTCLNEFERFWDRSGVAQFISLRT